MIIMIEEINKTLMQLLNCSFSKKETEDIFYNFIEFMGIYYKTRDFKGNGIEVKR